MKHKALDKPLSIQEMKRQMKAQNCIIGTVKISLQEIIDSDLNRFIDLLSNRLTGSLLLTDTNWHVTGHNGDTLHICVSGNACHIIKENG